MNTTENNKLIAEFMNCENPQAWELIPSPYELDWNWLMEVIEKIEILKYSRELFSQQSKVIALPISTKKEAIYNACIEFIKWYNQQNQ